MTTVRKGQYRGKLGRDEFRLRFFESFVDPAFHVVHAEIEAIEVVAWDGYTNARKSPVTAKAGPGFFDPDYDLSTEWRAARDRITAADAIQRDPSSASRVLVVCGSPRNDGTCPGEISKTFRMVELAQSVFDQAKMQTDVLDLSLLTSEYGKRIHPCKGCVSTAMPRCRCATGPARVIPITRWAKCMIG